MAISESLARVLTAGRPQFNARVVEAKHRYPSLDTEAFAQFLSTSVDSVVRSISAIAPERVATVTLVAYDLGLALIGQALAGAGARSTLIDRVWQLLAPQYARLLAAHPVEVLGSLTNAAVNINKVASAHPEQWLQQMSDLAPHADSIASLRALGQISAWRCGLAHYRLGAIRIADTLPEAVALTAVGATATSWQSIRDQLLVDPWRMPNNEQASGQTVGAFTGFGGLFAQPPSIRATADGFVVASADRFAYLMADAYGAVLLPATADEFKQAAPSTMTKTAVLKGSCLILTARQIDLELPTEGLSVVCNEHTVAITSPYTYSIRLLPLQ